ncbi:MAG: alpha/beta hydrolase [Burkholderiales bacterium]|nr:alpha/beta hydrolase [Burkholderiales bacterium]
MTREYKAGLPLICIFRQPARRRTDQAAELEIDIRDVVPAIQASTLVLHREGDCWTTLEEAQYLAGRLRHAKLRVLPGQDHFPWYGDQDRLMGIHTGECERRGAKSKSFSSPPEP